MVLIGRWERWSKLVETLGRGWEGRRWRERRGRGGGGGVQHTINLKKCYTFGALNTRNIEEGGATRSRGGKCIACLDLWT